jgi:hypothetical protein
MVNAVTRAVNRVDGRNRVVVGSLAPYGDEPGGERSHPVTFLRKLFCLDIDLAARPCPTRTHLDILSHHPINLSGPPRQSAGHPYDAASADLSRIREVLRAAERERRIAGPGKRRRHPVWATEFWWNRYLVGPDAPEVTPQKQARWVQESLYLFWKAGAKVAIYLPLVDSTALPAGLFEADETAKPAARAFAFPFVADRIGDRRVKLWGMAPVSGKLRVERRRGAGWRTERTFRVRAGAVFSRGLQLTGSATLRARVGEERSLAWNQR